MNLPPPPPPGAPATLPPPAPVGTVATVEDPFAPAADLIAAAPPPPVRPRFGGPEPQTPAPVTPMSLDDYVPEVEAAPVRKRRKGFVPTLPPRVLTFIAIPVALSTSLALTVSMLDDPIDDDSALEGAARLFANGWVVSALLVYVGLLWWMVAAAINARRISQLSVSPMTPLIVLVGGPVLIMVGAAIHARPTSTFESQEWHDFVGTGVVLAGGLIVTLGHLILLASYRSTAERLGGARQPWSVLIWLPILGGIIQATLTLLVYPQLESDRIIVFVWLLSLALSAVLTVYYVLSMWRAMASFDAAVRRDRTLEKADLLPVHFAYGRT